MEKPFDSFEKVNLMDKNFANKMILKENTKYTIKSQCSTQGM